MRHPLHALALELRYQEGKNPPSAMYRSMQRLVDAYMSATPEWMEMRTAMADPDLPSSPDDYTFRVSINRDNSIDIMCFGIPTVDTNCEGHYDTASDLPNWVQDRLAILMMTSNVKPTTDIRGVGRRISESVFWVYAPEPTPEEQSRL